MKEFFCFRLRHSLNTIGWDEQNALSWFMSSAYTPFPRPTCRGCESLLIR